MSEIVTFYNLKNEFKNAATYETLNAVNLALGFIGQKPNEKNPVTFPVLPEFLSSLKSSIHTTILNTSLKKNIKIPFNNENLRESLNEIAQTCLQQHRGINPVFYTSPSDYS